MWETDKDLYNHPEPSCAVSVLQDTFFKVTRTEKEKRCNWVDPRNWKNQYFIFIVLLMLGMEAGEEPVTLTRARHSTCRRPNKPSPCWLAQNDGPVLRGPGRHFWDSAATTRSASRSNRATESPACQSNAGDTEQQFTFSELASSSWLIWMPPGYLSSYHHLLTVSPSSNWSLRGPHFPSVFNGAACCEYRYKDTSIAVWTVPFLVEGELNQGLLLTGLTTSAWWSVKNLLYRSQVCR